MLNENEVAYLLIGGYAVNYYGYVRPTGDMDIWIESSRINAEKIVSVLEKFGFASPELTVDLFLNDKKVVRMGIPPIKLEVTTYIEGVEFEECYPEREVILIDDLSVNLISLKHLKATKRASGRLKDLDDLEHLP